MVKLIVQEIGEVVAVSQGNSMCRLQYVVATMGRG